jgi:hypothetical protein
MILQLKEKRKMKTAMKTFTFVLTVSKATGLEGDSSEEFCRIENDVLAAEVLPMVPF